MLVLHPVLLQHHVETVVSSQERRQKLTYMGQNIVLVIIAKVMDNPHVARHNQMVSNSFW